MKADLEISKRKGYWGATWIQKEQDEELAACLFEQMTAILFGWADSLEF